ncbi:beta strand repeat-containing protein [Spirosoma sp. KUDC1026]|uniref:beta strand repeat-containing protein n=1 Tax=Spirosoma sp. KUDC1026 TaxID=2745947 RepID=UPI00159BC57F|nr:hypothetical protein [Spirosoma sp. KUDC1026]QKZ14255.1 hypothetical protein HU175_17120 [Spirosoma sp. KUDC1026]
MSGTIFNDANGLTNNVISGTATNANSTLYANLVNSSNNVVAVSTIPTSGTYAFSGIWEGNYSVVLSTTAGTVGNTAPAASLPSNWVNIGEGIGATSAGDGTPNGVVSVVVSGTGTTNDVANINFGIDRRPSSASATVTLASQINPGGTTTVPIATTAFAGSDPEDGIYTAGLTGRQVALSPATNGTLYYNGTAVTVTTIITSFTSTLVTLDPNDGAITASFAYTIYDNALVSAPSATTVNVPFTTLSISGTIFDDANGLTDNVISGTATNAGGGLYVLVSNAANNTVVTSTLVPATGVYSLTGLYPASYSVRLSTTSVAVGAPAPAVSLPTNWTSIGEGTATAGDGTPNGITSVTLTTTSAAGVNFGIDQRPISVSAVTLASQPNPGGTATVPIATTAFAGSDPEDGTYPAGLTGRQVALSPATNGTLYYNGTAVTVTTIITSFTSTLVTLDPNDGAITASFAYTIYDNALVSAPSATTVNLPFTLLTISGTIFNDANGLTDGVISGTATNAGGPLYVIVSNAANNNVVASTLVPATGVYSLTGLYPASYSVRLSTTSVAVGATAPAVSLPANFTSIGEGIAAAGDGTPNGITSVTLTTANVTGVNFGLDQLPVPTSTTLATQVNPGGNNGISIAPSSFTGTDADGTITSIRYTAFPANVTSLTIGTAVYTAASFPAGGVTAATGTALRIDPIDGAVTATIPFSVIDNAGKESTTSGSVSVPFTLLTISGTIFDDANGLTDGVISGTATNAGGSLYVIVSNAASNTVVTSTLVPATGVYSLTGLYPASYNLSLSTTSVAVGAPAPAVSLPANFTSIGEGIATAGDGTPNGITSVTLTTANVTGVNFGLDQLPVPTSVTLAAQANPGGTNSIIVPSTIPNGTDADGIVSRVLYTAFPANATSISIGGTVYTAATFPPAGVTVTVGTTLLVDPVDGLVTVSVPFRVIDNALQPSLAIGLITIPFTCPTPLCPVVTGQRINRI